MRARDGCAETGTAIVCPIRRYLPPALMHCNHFTSAPLTRRDMLRKCANGFGMVALAGLLAEETSAAGRDLNPLAPRAAHHPARAKSIIFLYMDGGPSQVDTFDPKARLIREHG